IMKKTNMRRFGAIVAGLSLVLAACGGGDDAASDTTAAAAGGELEGMKGTMPLVDLSDEFKTGLNEFWTAAGNAALEDYSYAAEAFDAVMLVALAAEVAGTDGSALANEIQNVSRDGEKCTTVEGCMELIKAGTDIDYDGASGPQDMNGNGEPVNASYGVLTFGADNRFSYDDASYVLADAPESDIVDLVPSGVERKGDGVLKIGSLLPETGSLAFLGPPEFAGVEYAISLLNAAGGILGKPVEYVQGDSGDTSTDTASTTVDRLLGENVDAIIGAASSSVSLTVIDKITAAGVVQFSPANTSDKLTTYDDKGLYFRTAPPDKLQGAVLANLIAGDGAATVYIMALDDAYGTGLADAIEANLTAAGVEVVGKKIYDPKATTFDAEVDEIVAANPDAIMLVTFDEGSRILRTMVEKGVGPKVKKVYGCDGNMGNALGENFDSGK
ncbi:MAG: ABC transporter substrate-binding protein, partial [Ilumatobacteraceae bacterium]